MTGFDEYLVAHARLVRLGVATTPILSEANYYLAEDNLLTASRDLTEWMLDHVTKDPQDDPLGRVLWDEVSRWERITAYG